MAAVSSGSSYVTTKQCFKYTTLVDIFKNVLCKMTVTYSKSHVTKAQWVCSEADTSVPKWNNDHGARLDNTELCWCWQHCRSMQASLQHRKYRISLSYNKEEEKIKDKICSPVPMLMTIPTSSSPRFITMPAMTFRPARFSGIVAIRVLKVWWVKAAILSKCVMFSGATLIWNNYNKDNT